MFHRHYSNPDVQVTLFQHRQSKNGMSSLILHRFVSILIFPVFRKYFNFDIKIKIRYDISMKDILNMSLIASQTGFLIEQNYLKNYLRNETKCNIQYTCKD